MTQHVLLVTDIFGYCQGLQRLQQDLAVTGALVTIVDPYSAVAKPFADEREAYATYCELCGHDRYVSLVVSASQRPVDLAIGFSAGASALWRALCTPAAVNIKQAMLFYPGQIYQHLKLTPEQPTAIIFGSSEPHFSVDAMLQLLSEKPAVSVIKTPYQHGFMNPPSVAFNEAGYQHYLETIKSKLR